MMILKKITSVICSIIFAGFTFTACMSSSTYAGEVASDRQQVLLIPEATIQANANSSYAQIIAEAKANGTLNRDAATVNRVQLIADRLIAETRVFRPDAVNWDWQVNVITEGTVNAWCMPGGKIVVYTGIINALKMTDDELAVVMGHEISHALREHSREQISRQMLTSLGANALASLLKLGETGNSALALAAQYFITLPFSRSQETEADTVGIELMARAGYDPTSAVTVWQKMSALSKTEVPEMMSTHPSHASRISNLTVLSARVYPLYEQSKGKR